MYVADNERLSYVDLSGPAKTASRPILSGLSTPGPWIGEMEEFLDYAQGEIPAEDPTLVFPGEDPFYYALQRRPLFPVLTFDETVNPYADRQLLQLAKERGVRWLVVKRHLQLKGNFVADHLLQVFQNDFTLHKQLVGYAVYKRTTI